jgi:hypothetical protein
MASAGHSSGLSNDLAVFAVPEGHFCSRVRAITQKPTDRPDSVTLALLLLRTSETLFCFTRRMFQQSEKRHVTCSRFPEYEKLVLAHKR